MQEQLEALHEVKTFLDRNGVQHLVIGGIANAVWGRPRATRDADFKVLLGEQSIDEFVALISTKFQFRINDPVAFVKATYVAPIYASSGIEVDLGLGFLPYEEEAVKKGVEIEVEGVSFLVCTAEDLIIHKAISEREKDWSDIEGILIRQGKQLDQKYIGDWLNQFAEALERPSLLTKYEGLRKKVLGKPSS
jgi:hypothetical protein